MQNKIHRFFSVRPWLASHICATQYRSKKIRAWLYFAFPSSSASQSSLESMRTFIHFSLRLGVKLIETTINTFDFRSNRTTRHKNKFWVTVNQALLLFHLIVYAMCTKICCAVIWWNTWIQEYEMYYISEGFQLQLKFSFMLFCC